MIKGSGGTFSPEKNIPIRAHVIIKCYRSCPETMVGETLNLYLTPTLKL